MNHEDVFSELRNNGFLDYGRVNGVVSILSEITKVRAEHLKDETILELSKRKADCTIRIGKKTVFGGRPGLFNEEFNLLREDCWVEYARSIRDKQLLISAKEVDEFYKIILVPILLEAVNVQNMNMNKFGAILDSKHAHLTKWLFFTKDTDLKTRVSKNSLFLRLNKSFFEIKNLDVKISRKAKVKNMAQYYVEDVFTPGIPYTMMILNDESIDYKTKGDNNELVEIARILLETIYEYIMVHKV